MTTRAINWDEQRAIWAVLDHNVWMSGEPRPVHSVVVELDRAGSYYRWLDALETPWCWDMAKPAHETTDLIEVMFEDVGSALLFKLTYGGR